MEQEALRREQRYKGRFKPRSAKLSFTGLLALIGRLLFYRPVWTEENQQHQNVRFIFVRFSAWHFAGSDLLWAGLAIRLFQAAQENFGKLQLALYRVVQHDEEEEIRKKVFFHVPFLEIFLHYTCHSLFTQDIAEYTHIRCITLFSFFCFLFEIDKLQIVEDGLNEWRSKKLCCCPLWFLFLVILLITLVLLVLLVTVGLPKTKEETGEGGNKTGKSQLAVLDGLAIAAIGVPAAGAVRFIFKMGKNLIFNQDINIRRGMDNKRVSNQLGFMNEVRTEIWLLSSFIRFMEVFERRRIRVVLEITNLDRCSPKKIVGVLDAINILLSDEDSPFISLLAVNPEVLVQQVDFADGCFSKEDRAYAFLNRIVTLAFTIPPLCDASKRKVFYNLISGQSEMTEDIKMMADKPRTKGSTKPSPSLDDFSVESTQTTKESSIPLIDKKDIKETTAKQELREEEVEKLIDSAFESVLVSDRGNLNNYMLDDAMSMRRVINSIRVTVVIMEATKAELPPPEQIAAWVVLANHWPCRLSWILQCLEDDQQRAVIDDNDMNVVTVDNSKTLWEIFRESRAELHVMREHIEDLLEQDGDPEMFEMFLRVDFPFTVKDVEKFQLTTVNLDHTIRKEMGQIRGTSRLKDSGWMRNLAPLPIRKIINMSTEDICKEV